MNKKIFYNALTIILLSLFSCSTKNQDLNEPPSQVESDVNAYFVGHSLIGFDITQMMTEIAISDEESTFTHSKQITNGATLQHNWQNPTTADVGNYTQDLSQNKFNKFIITEAIPLENHLIWSDTYNMVDNFYSAFKDNNENGQVYIYETWHCINSGTTGCQWDEGSDVPWRTRLEQDKEKWESISIYLNQKYTNDVVHIIPGGQALAKLYDAIENNEINGVTNIDYFFSDDIHLNDFGHYYIACVMYATLFKKSPVGLTYNTKKEWGEAYESPGLELGTKLQEMAWATVCENSEITGVTCN